MSYWSYNRCGPSEACCVLLRIALIHVRGDNTRGMLVGPDDLSGIGDNYFSGMVTISVVGVPKYAFSLDGSVGGGGGGLRKMVWGG